MWGELRPPAPAVSPAWGVAAVAVLVVVLSAGGMFLRSSGFGPTARPELGPPVMVAGAGDASGGGGLEDSDRAMWQELNRLHRQYVHQRPLAEDTGMQLVSYPDPK